MSEKKRIQIEINRPISKVGELKDVIVDMGYDYIYLTDEEVKKLLITGVLKKETDTHVIDIGLSLTDTRSDCSLALGTLESVGDHDEIFSFDVFIDNIIETDMHGKGDDLVTTFVVNDTCIIDMNNDDKPMTIHECMEYLRDFAVNNRIDYVAMIMPDLKNTEVPDDPDADVEVYFKSFICYRKDEDEDNDTTGECDE